MSRIKKRGLDYFPMNTDFMQNRIVRRIMKQEGDGAVAVLLDVLSYIYADQGYYVHADPLFYEDLSATLYEKSSEDVIRIIRLAVEYGLFDSALFSKYAILTSVEIQQQYFFSTKRRTAFQFEPGYCLLSDEELAGFQSKKNVKTKKTKTGKTTDRNHLPQKSENVEEEASECLFHREKISDENAPDAIKPENINVTFIPENVTSGTHSIAQNSIAQHSIAQQSVAENSKNLPPSVPPTGEVSGTAGERREADAEEISQERAKASCQGGCNARRKEWTQTAIDALQPPVDGRARNFGGLLDNMHLYRIPPTEQYAIIRKSDYGAIGNPVWKGLYTLHGSNGKIKLPGRFLLSVLNAGG